MRILPALVILMLVFLFYKESFAQTNAYNTAVKENQNQDAAGAAGMMQGAMMAAAFCGGGEPVLCSISIAGALESLLTKKNAGNNTDPSKNPLTPDYKSACEIDPKLCENDIYNSPAYTQAVEDLRNIAAPFGLNIDDPKSVDKFLSEHAGDIGGIDQAMASLSPDQLARIEKIKKDVASKFNISSVPLEGGGGRSLASHGRDSSGLDLSKLFGGLNGEKKDELPGLQRKLASGEPVGVASDDIFKIVSRRYQTKIQSKTFLFKR